MTVLNISTSSPCSARKKISIWQRLFNFETLRKERLELRSLSDSQLKDIGITPDQARKEADRPAWDVPSNWHERC